jgi:rifampicin phosphotransferase
MAIIVDGKPLVFEAPGPGSWRLGSLHVPRPWSRFHGEIFGPNVSVAAAACAQRYGSLSGRGRFELVHGFGYGCYAPADPAEYPARFAAAEETFATRRWRGDLAMWQDTVKPATIRAQLALQRVDAAALPSGAQLAHIAVCRENLARMIRQHHQFNLAATLPISDLIAHLRAWSDQPLGIFLALVRGSAPESAGAMAELSRLADAIRADRAAQALLLSTKPYGDILAGLRAMSGEVGAAATGYIDLVGYRILDGLEVGAAFGLEVPEVLVKGILNAVETGAPAPDHASPEEIARVRDLVPAAHRNTFDDLLGEARHNSRLRDERGNYSDVWAAGICRRAILAAGARLVSKGRLNDASHLVEADWAEMQAILTSQAGPAADELAARRRFRDSHHAAEAPPLLGEPLRPPVVPDGLPPAALRMVRASMATGEAMFGTATAPNEPRRLRGIGASPGSFAGIARVIFSPADFGRLQSGDILVTPSTTESFNIVLPLLGAIVTDTGGLLSHAAIVSRELGIPGVVGTREASKQIADGAALRVDGLTGEVFVL